MKYRFCLLSNYLKKIVRSPSRMFLTLSGLILSVMVLMTGLIFSQTYMEAMTARIQIYMDNYASVIEGEADYSVYDRISEMNGKKELDLVSGVSHVVKEIKQGKHKVSISISDVRTNWMNLNFLAEDGMTDVRYKTSLKYGRLLNQDDIDEKKSVAVINDELAGILYGKENAVGESITFPVYKVNPQNGLMEVDYYEKIEVVGVIEASKTEKDNVSKAFNSDKAEMVNFLVYTPLSLQMADKDMSDYKMRVMLYGNKDNYTANNDEIKYLCNGVLFGRYNFYNYSSLKEEAEREIEEMQTVIIYIVGFMLIISAVSIINTMLFSVKERINEIGIRKAIGAFDDDIVKQFVFEGLVYGVVSSVIGIIVSIIISADIFLLLKNTLFSMVNLVVTWESIALSMILSVTIGVAASLFPAVYASKIKITEAIKYD